MTLFLSRKSAWRVADRMVSCGIADRFKIVGRYRKAADRSVERGFVVLAWRGAETVLV